MTTTIFNNFIGAVGHISSFEAAYLLIGYGAKQQIADTAGTKAGLDEIAAGFDARHGRSRWLTIFGGDLLKPDVHDVAHLAHHLKTRWAAPLMAIQSDVVIQWGGVDPHVDSVFYFDTEYDVAARKVLWGGLRDGRL